MNDSHELGKLITFYSYKGGTGRSMALANIACLIGKHQVSGLPLRVLVIDWDLEAPGLQNFFIKQFNQKSNKECPGIIDYFYALRDLLNENKELYKKFQDDLLISSEEAWKILDEELPISDYIVSDVEERVDLIKAGRLSDPEYIKLVSSFDWFGFYNKFGLAIDVFRQLIASKYDYCLIDSRTGVTDTSGICTMLLPEKLVGVFTPNRQSLDGLIDLFRRAINYRIGSNNDLRPLTVFPLPSRIDSAEHELQKEWRLDYQAKLQDLFKEVYDVEDCNLTEYFDEVKLPHKSYYAYGEKIAVLEEPSDALSLSRAYQVFFERLIGLDHAWQPLDETEITPAIHQQVDYDEKLRRLQLEVKSGVTVVPDYKYDIFISYARIDDEPTPGTEQGWVTTLVKGLKTRLAQLLGRSDTVSIYVDYRLAHSEPLTPMLVNIAAQSAILVIILSPAYLVSEGYLREKNTFLELVRQRVRTGPRVFVVERHRFQPAEKPEELLGLLGYRFWAVDEENNRLRILGEPTPNPNDYRYYDMLNNLAFDLTDELKRLRQAAEQQKGSPPITEQLPADTRPAIFLAEVTDDLLGQRDEVQRYLDQAGFRVLPAIAFESADALQQSLAQDLPQCKLFVQLLSPLSGRHRYPRRQYDGARGAKIPILQWCDPTLKLDSVTDPDQLALLQGDTVLAVRLEEFKREVVKRALAKPEIPIQPSRGPLVLLNASDEDASLGQAVAEVIERNGVGYVMPLRAGKPAEIRQDLEHWLLASDGVIIVYGAATRTWVRNQVLHYRKFMSLRQQPLKALAVFEGPPEEKEDLRVKLPGMRILNCRKSLDENLLREFLTTLTAGAAV